MMKPCCLQEITCEEYEQRKNAESVPVLGGAIGKADKCPGDASEAHMIIQKSKIIMKTQLDISGSLEKGISYTIFQNIIYIMYIIRLT